MAIESITLSTENATSGPMTPRQFERRTGNIISALRGQQAGKVSEAGEIGVPEDADFEDLDWLESPEIEAVAAKLIEKYPSTFRAAARSSVVYFWNRQGGEKGGKQTLGMCVKVPKTMKAVAPELEFMIWLAADNVRDAMLTPYQIEAVIFHELKHVGRTDKNKPTVVPHDATVFRDEIEEYGLWMPDITKLGAVFQQLRLDGEE